MVLRKIVFATLLTATLVGGGWLLGAKNAATTAEKRSAVVPHRPTDSTQATPKPFDWPGHLSKQIHTYATAIQHNKELLLYAAIAGFGMLMVVLAIGNARSTPKDSATQIMDILRQEKEKAEHLAKLKSEFLNQVSHELRTPLAVILGYLECMTDGLYGEIEAKHKEILQTVAKQSSHLKNMIDQILIYSRLESSKQPLRSQEFSVQKLCADLSDTFNFLSKQKGLDLNWQVSQDLPALRTDPERLKEILSNLLQNALKYTDSGSIRVSVSNRPKSDLFIFEVADTGLGIPEHHLSSIFEPFIQVHKTSTGNSRGGIGLGLSIVKKHIEQLNGTIRVESQVGKGTTFSVTLPQLHRAAALRGWRLLQGLKVSMPSFVHRINLDARSTLARSKANSLDVPPPPHQAVG
ncbi:MAG: HAMP domain-containing sensor histidine kinase [Deltaproteobacteria bacterium]|nr:HAMP domain-containing sensor histidine kinase [Deltaproteobacteria bacterium]